MGMQDEYDQISNYQLINETPNYSGDNYELVTPILESFYTNSSFFKQQKGFFGFCHVNLNEKSANALAGEYAVAKTTGGWKLHIALDDGDIHNIAHGWKIASQILMKHKICKFKIVMSNQIPMRGQIGGERNENIAMHGRQITIYSSRQPSLSMNIWQEILTEIEQALRNEKIKPDQQAVGTRMIINSWYINYRHEQMDRREFEERNDDPFAGIILPFVDQQNNQDFPVSLFPNMQEKEMDVVVRVTNHAGSENMTEDRCCPPAILECYSSCRSACFFCCTHQERQEVNQQDQGIESEELETEEKYCPPSCVIL